MDISKGIASHLCDHATLFIGIFLFVILYAAFKAVIYPRFFSPTRSYPGPPTHWLFGNIFDILGSEPGRSYMQWHKEVRVGARTP